MNELQVAFNGMCKLRSESTAKGLMPFFLQLLNLKKLLMYSLLLFLRELLRLKTRLLQTMMGVVQKLGFAIAEV